VLLGDWQQTLDLSLIVDLRGNIRMGKKGQCRLYCAAVLPLVMPRQPAHVNPPPPKSVDASLLRQHALQWFVYPVAARAVVSAVPNALHARA
jgi:hypothetical protein